MKDGSEQSQFRLLRSELRRTSLLGFPLALGELGWMSTYIVDAVMVGRLPHSALAISASSMGNTIYYALVFCVIRGLDGVMTLVAQAYGADDREDCLYTLAQSMIFVVLGTPTVMLATIGSLALLPYFGIPADIVSATASYLHALVWSSSPLLLYMALRRYLQSTDRVALITTSLVTANIVNLLFDWIFLYGHMGVHAMGIAGSGWATCVVRIYMLALLIGGFWIAIGQQGLQLEWGMLRPDLKRLQTLIRIGWPSAIENVTDLGFSTWMSIVCARFGATLLAAHQVVLDLDAFVYMVPLGLSYATVARVGQTFGKAAGERGEQLSKAVPAVRRSARASLMLGLGYIAVASILFAGFPKVWAGIYTNDPAVIAAAAPIFLICGFLQIGDAANVLFCAALTGLGDTRTPFLVNTAVSWLLGAPLGWILAFHSPLALEGLWIGRAAAAILTGTIMAIVWRSRMKTLESGRFATNLTQLRPRNVE